MWLPGAEKSTVLNFQQRQRFVKCQVSTASVSRGNTANAVLSACDTRGLSSWRDHFIQREHWISDAASAS
jgi:hypothetical protein